MKGIVQLVRHIKYKVCPTCKEQYWHTEHVFINQLHLLAPSTTLAASDPLTEVQFQKHCMKKSVGLIPYRDSLW